MIKFFRLIRQQLLSQNKFSKYLLYAIGEIVLVVIGILIALQINNWNEERVQERELNDLMKSISSAIQSDITYLKLIRTGRATIGKKVDSIYNSFSATQNAVLVFNDYALISNAFRELNNIIYYQPNLSAFAALKNSIYLSKLQGTDIELLLNSFYAAAARLQKQEEDYNQSLKADYQIWTNKFRNNDGLIFKNSWDYTKSGDFHNKFMTIFNDSYTKTLLAKGYEEFRMVDLYDHQIELGEKFIEMVAKGETNFDEQTKIDFSGTFHSYSDVDVLNLMVNGKIPSDFSMIFAQSGNVYYSGIKYEDEAIRLTYPENKFSWGSPYFRIEALNGRVAEMDFTKYQNVTLQLKGAKGGEQFALMMKDKYDPPDGTESRVDITVSDTWETFEIPLEKFATADKRIIATPLGFVFLGGEGKTIYVRSIQFNKGKQGLEKN